MGMDRKSRKCIRRVKNPTHYSTTNVLVQDVGQYRMWVNFFEHITTRIILSPQLKYFLIAICKRKIYLAIV
jgi:hypothetical protein